MFIKQGKLIEYADEKWNIQADYKNCDVRNKQLLSVENNNRQIIGVACGDTQIEVSVMFDQKETPVILTGFPEDFENVSVLICNAEQNRALYKRNAL
jgi:hypothetical protein